MILVLCACGSTDGNGAEKGYDKEVDTYTLETKGGNVTFELAKELGYEVDYSGSNLIKLINPADKSDILVTAMYDFSTGGKIVRTEDMYSADSYTGFKEITVGSYTGMEIYRYSKDPESPVEYETRFVLTEPDESNNVLAVKITVQKSPMYPDFDVKTFISNEDFVHFLNSFSAAENAAE